MLDNEVNEGWLVTEYSGQFAVSYDKAVNILEAYEWIHGTNRVAGAMRSLMSQLDNQIALKEFYRGRLSEVESAMIELKPKKEEEK